MKWQYHKNNGAVIQLTKFFIKNKKEKTLNGANEFSITLYVNIDEIH